MPYARPRGPWTRPQRRNAASESWSGGRQTSIGEPREKQSTSQSDRERSEATPTSAIMSAFPALFGPTLQTKDGPKPTETVLADKKAVGIYFSAHW